MNVVLCSSVDIMAVKLWKSKKFKILEKKQKKLMMFAVLL